jgi:hypothetical protein
VIMMAITIVFTTVSDHPECSCECHHMYDHNLATLCNGIYDCNYNVDTTIMTIVAWTQGREVFDTRSVTSDEMTVYHYCYQILEFTGFGCECANVTWNNYLHSNTLVKFKKTTFGVLPAIFYTVH